MKMKKRLLKPSFALLAAAFLLLVLATSFAWARRSVRVSVAPARQELAADPGEITAVHVRFYNPTEIPISGPLRTADFIVERDDGVPTFLEDGEASSRFAAASWVTIPYDRITVSPQESVNIEAKIRIPRNASPGGRYFAVYFEHGGSPPSISEGDKKEMAVSYRVASLIYLKVNGPTTEEATLKTLDAPRFLEYGPIETKTAIANLGSYHLRPQGTLTLTSMFGKVIDQQPLKEANIFPDVSRTFENTLGQNKRWLIGKYRIDLTATYGDSGKVLTGTIFSWVFPWKLAAMILLAVVIVGLLITVTLRSFRRREEELEDKIERLEKQVNNKP